MTDPVTPYRMDAHAPVRAATDPTGRQPVDAHGQPLTSPLFPGSGATPPATTTPDATAFDPIAGSDPGFTSIGGLHLPSLTRLERLPEDLRAIHPKAPERRLPPKGTNEVPTAEEGGDRWINYAIYAGFGKSGVDIARLVKKWPEAFRRKELATAITQTILTAPDKRIINPALQTVQGRGLIGSVKDGGLRAREGAASLIRRIGGSAATSDAKAAARAATASAGSSTGAASKAVAAAQTFTKWDSGLMMASSALFLPMSVIQFGSAFPALNKALSNEDGSFDPRSNLDALVNTSPGRGGALQLLGGSLGLGMLATAAIQTRKGPPLFPEGASRGAKALVLGRAAANPVLHPVATASSFGRAMAVAAKRPKATSINGLKRLGSMATAPVMANTKLARIGVLSGVAVVLNQLGYLDVFNADRTKGRLDLVGDALHKTPVLNDSTLRGPALLGVGALVATNAHRSIKAAGSIGATSLGTKIGDSDHGRAARRAPARRSLLPRQVTSRRAATWRRGETAPPTDSDVPIRDGTVRGRCTAWGVVGSDRARLHCRRPHRRLPARHPSRSPLQRARCRVAVRRRPPPRLRRWPAPTRRPGPRRWHRPSQSPSSRPRR